MEQLNQITDEEWEYLRRTLEAVMNAVKIAHPGGASQEQLAINQGWAEGPNQFPRNDFIFRLFAAMPDEVHRLNEQKRVYSGSGVEAIITEAIEMCQKATVLVQAKVPQEQRAFRHIVLFLANKVARAAKEGGFLGMGGKMISAPEKSVIDRLMAVLPPE